MNGTTLAPSRDAADVDPAHLDADRFLGLAERYESRARRMRERATALGPGLSPLRAALCRRASELELATAALGAVSEGERACSRTAASDVPTPPEPPRPNPTKPPLPEVPPPSS